MTISSQFDNIRAVQTEVPSHIICMMPVQSFHSSHDPVLEGRMSRKQKENLRIKFHKSEIEWFNIEGDFVVEELKSMRKQEPYVQAERL